MKIPERLTLEAIKAFARDVYQQLQAWTTGNIDLKGRRIGGAGEAVAAFDYVRKADLDGEIQAINARIATVGVDERRTALQANIVGDFLITGNYQFKSQTAFVGVFEHAISAARTWVFPDITDDVVTRIAAQNLANKMLVDGTDQTKQLVITLSGATTGKLMTVISSHTADRTLTLPNITGTLA